MPDQPRRFQLKRTKGYRKPEGAVVVARPSKWANPWRICWEGPYVHETKHDSNRCRPSRIDSITAFRHAVLFPVIGQPQVPTVDEIRQELRGKDLACWCRPGKWCHGDVLLDIANGSELSDG